MKKSHTSVAIIVDTWFPDFGGKQVHIKNLRTKLHQHFHTKTELYYSGITNPVLRIFWPFWVIIKILKDHKTHPYDLIHSHGVIAGIPAKVVSLIVKIPVVHTVHGSPNLDQKLKNLGCLMEKIVLTKIKFTQQISVSENFKKHTNINNPIIIPNGVDVVAFNKVRTRKNKNPTLIWVGKDIPEKGVSILKEAIVRVRKKIPKLETELVTGGRLTGKKLIRAYKKSHVFVLPSLAEGQPITMLEAWAAKLPIIATNVGDNSKLVKHEENGLLIEPDNLNQLVKAILKVLRSRTKGKPMGLAGHRLVNKQFSWLSVAKSTYAVYKQVISSRHSGKRQRIQNPF